MMGKRNRERIVKILAGSDELFRRGVVEKSVSLLQRLSTSRQIGVLSDALAKGSLYPNRLRAELEKNAHREMRIGADKILAKGGELGVDELLRDYHLDKEFQALASSVGLDEQWFIALAEQEIKGRATADAA